VEPDGRKQEVGVVGARRWPNWEYRWWEYSLQCLLVLHIVGRNAGVQARQPRRLSRTVLLGVTSSVSFPYLFSSHDHLWREIFVIILFSFSIVHLQYCLRPLDR
jgi:hypothetical protein